MGGGAFKDMGYANEVRGFLHGQILIVDIMGPDVADTLFAFKVILGHVPHGDGHGFKMLDLPFGGGPIFGIGINENEGKNADHDQDVDDDYPDLFHNVFRLLYITHFEINIEIFILAFGFLL